MGTVLVLEVSTTLALGLAAPAGEELKFHIALGHACLHQCILAAHDHGFRPTEVRSVQRPALAEHFEQSLATCLVQASRQQICIHRLSGEQVKHAKAVEETVLQVLERFTEHCACGRLVAVKQRVRRGCIIRKNLLDLAQDGRDARTRRHAKVMQPRTFLEQEPALRIHDVQHSACLESVVRKRGELASRHLLDADLPLALLGRRTQRVAASHFFPIDGRAQGQILACIKRKRLGQLRGHFEGNNDRIRGFSGDFGDAKGVECCHGCESSPHLPMVTM